MGGPLSAVEVFSVAVSMSVKMQEHRLESRFHTHSVFALGQAIHLTPLDLSSCICKHVNTQASFIAGQEGSCLVAVGTETVLTLCVVILCLPTREHICGMEP